MSPHTHPTLPRSPVLTAAMYSAAAYRPGMPCCGGSFTSFSAACASPRAPCGAEQQEGAADQRNSRSEAGSQPRTAQP